MRCATARHFRTLCLASCLAALAALSCSPTSPDGGALPGQRPWRGIIHGTPATARQFDAVVEIFYQGSGICSGTLITDTVVLTAAHCVHVKDCTWNPVTQRSENCQLETDPSTFRIYVHSSWGDAGYQVRAVTDIHAHPDYDEDAFVDDIALLRIEWPFGDVTPIPALSGEPGLAWTEADLGLEGIDVGFGLTETGASGDRLMVQQQVDVLCLGDAPCGHASPRTMCSNYREGLICSGDSGGPFLIERDGVLYSAAVHAYGDEDCRYFGCNTLVSAYAGWIADYLGGDGLKSGAECIDNGQCQSGICSLGVCCDRACTNAPCEACSAARGAYSSGQCSWSSAACDDGDLCTEGDRCDQGVCRAGWSKQCARGDVCNEASACDPATGACVAGAPKPIGTACDDGNACTLNDYCLQGDCVGEGTVYCPPPGECQLTRGNGCNAVTGECMYVDKPDGTACGAAGGKATCQRGVCEKPSAASGGCGAAADVPGAGAPSSAMLGALAAILLARRRRAGNE